MHTVVGRGVTWLLQADRTKSKPKTEVAFAPLGSDCAYVQVTSATRQSHSAFPVICKLICTFVFLGATQCQVGRPFYFPLSFLVRSISGDHLSACNNIILTLANNGSSAKQCQISHTHSNKKYKKKKKKRNTHYRRSFYSCFFFLHCESLTFMCSLQRLIQSLD